MSPPINMPSTSTSSSFFCGNCHQPIENETSLTKFRCKNFFGPSEEEIQIFDAIAYIYGIPWSEFVTYSKSCTENNFENGQIETSVSFCILCAKLLSNNFVAHKRLENVSHPSSIIQKLNTFRQQKHGKGQSNPPQENEITENCDSPQENEFPESLDSPPDNDYDDNDDLFDNFQLSNNDKQDEQPEIEVKYEPVDRGVQEKLDDGYLVTRSLRSRQLLVKLDRLPEEQYESAKSKRKRRIKIAKNSVAKKRTDKILARKEVKDEDYVPDESEVDTRKTPKPKRGRKKIADPTKAEKCECKICGKKVRNVDYYKKVHLPQHYKKVVKCFFCDKSLPKKGMKKHIVEFHSKEDGKSVTCPICNRKIVSYNFEYHMKYLHTRPRQTFKCDKCDKEYLNKMMHTEHMLTHSEEFTPHLCGICGKVFKLKSSFENHLKRHERGKMKPRKSFCDLCQLEFPGFQSLKEHEAKVHAGPRAFTCQECGKSYKSKRELAQHVKLHNEVKEKGDKGAKCEKCNIFLKHSLSLRKHNLRFHKDKILVFECSFCAKRFTCATYLRKHEQQHKENPNFEPKRATRMSKLFQKKSTAEGDENNSQEESQNNFIVCTLETFKPAR